MLHWQLSSLTVRHATYYNIALRDLDQNITLSWAFTTPGIEVKRPNMGDQIASPSFATLNKADLELPSDFSGQAASLRRAYISLDSYGKRQGCTDRDGIFRIDDTTVYMLMDTSNDRCRSPSTASPISAPMPRASCWLASVWAPLARQPCPPGSPIHRLPAPSPAGTQRLSRLPALPTRVPVQVVSVLPLSPGILMARWALLSPAHRR